MNRQALFLLDPVDVTIYAPEGADYPSACAGLRALGGTGRPLPLAVVGSGLNDKDCVPPGSNHAAYYDASTAPAWEVVVANSGHFSFVDERGGMMDAICRTGTAPDAVVRELSQAMMVAWAEAMVRDPAGSEVRQLKMGLDAGGRVVAGLASFDAIQKLFQTEEAALRLLQKRAPELQVAMRLKNFELPP